MPVLVRLVLIAAVAGALLLGSGDRGAFDFQAFYCAGAAVRAQADPYLAQPLGACEHRLTDGTYAALAPGVVLPAPQPGYDLGAFALLSLLPFGIAKAVWGALLGVALAISVYCVFRVTGLGWPRVGMAFAASLVLPSLAFGEMTALFAAAACGSMWFARRGWWAAAGAAGAAALVEPHLGLPICVCLALWQRGTRLAMTLSVGVLAAVSVAVLGLRENVEYAVTVLPLHALSEISSDAQLGLSAVLHGLHVSDAAALRVGSVSYVLVAVCGVFVARALASRFGDGAFLVAVPAAFAAIGGTFVHVTEVFAAVPLALLLLARAPRQRVPVLVAAVLLCVPWIAGIERGNALAFALLGAIAVAVLLWEKRPVGVMIALGAAAVTLGVLLVTPAWYAHAAATPHAALAATPIDPAYAQASWRRWNEIALSSGSAPSWLLRGATWLGLLLLAASAMRLSRPREARIAAAARSTPSVR